MHSSGTGASDPISIGIAGGDLTVKTRAGSFSRRARRRIQNANGNKTRTRVPNRKLVRGARAGLAPDFLVALPGRLFSTTRTEQNLIEYSYEKSFFTNISVSTNVVFICLDIYKKNGPYGTRSR